MPFQIFKAGTRRDHHGKLVTITAEDVAQAAAAYHTATHEAPIVIGHPSDNAPAFGWVQSLSAEDGVLSLLSNALNMSDTALGKLAQIPEVAPMLTHLDGAAEWLALAS